MSITREPALGPFYDAIAIGGTPGRADLEAEGIPEMFFDVVRAHVRVIHKLRAEGNNGEARERAREFAHDLREALGPDWEASEIRENRWPTTDEELDAAVARIQRR